MPATSIQSPFPLFTDIDGQPLEQGQVWLGTAGNDPISSPITAYWDAALTQVVTQPVTTRGGYPMNGSSIGRLYVNADYSILVRNRVGYDVLSAPNATERYDSSLVTFIQAGAGAVVRTAQAKMRDIVSVKDFGAVGEGVTDDTVAIQAAVAASTAAGKILYFPSGTYVCNSVLGAIGCSMSGDGFLSSTIEYTGTLADFIQFNGRVIENLEFKASNPSHTSYFTKTSASFQSFNNCKWDGPVLAATGALLYMNTALIIEINGCFFNGHNISLVGQDGGGAGFCNGVTVSNTLFNAYRSAAIQNPGQGWNIENTLFEHTPSAAPVPNAVLAINCDTAITVYGLNISGCWFGDNTSAVAHSYIRFRGNGLSITGSYINGSGFNNCTVVETTGTSSGITISGNYISNFANVVNTGGIATNVFVFANRLNAVTNEITNTFTNVLPVTGINFPSTAVPSANANTLDDYDEYASPGSACSGAITTSASWTITKIGRVVTLYLPQVQGTASANASFLFGDVIPAKYRPADRVSSLSAHIVNNAANRATPGLIFVDTTGEIYVFFDGTLSATFTAGANAGLAYRASVSWFV